MVGAAFLFIKSAVSFNGWITIHVALPNSLPDQQFLIVYLLFLIDPKQENPGWKSTNVYL